MTSPNVTLTVRLRVKEGMQARLQESGRALVHATRSEDGCLTYVFHEDNSATGLFLFYEVWANREAFEKHLLTPHLTEFRKLLDEVLLDPAEFIFWKPIS
jgi:quinol monooxygenase YgiN